jgi:hypothetical protein
VAAVGLALTLGLGGCSSDSDSDEAGLESDATAGTGEANDADEAGDASNLDDADENDNASDPESGADVVVGTFPSLENMPECEEIHQLLGDAVAELSPVPEEELDNTFEDALRYGFGCAWFSEEVVDPESTDVFDYFQDAAGISFGITIDHQLGDKESLSDMGWVAEDPRLDDVGGYIVTMGQEFDPSEPLGSISPQVVIGQATFTFSAMGVMLGDAESLSHLTNDWAVDASLQLYKELTGAGG